jgi:alkanesulfonate monooxygenase SsuD/methylene tetrahydromethanopterin reductase-like flavin-dependent oxidoreductase (luciferase family)
VILGIGGGWNAEEMENHGTTVKSSLEAAARADRGDEGELWTQDEANYHGEFVNFEPVWCGPGSGSD